MLSVETHRGNREAIREGSYGRFLYNYFRYYDPISGRYLSAEPLGQLGGLNVFLYSWNDPLNFFDSTGDLPKPPGGRWTGSTLHSPWAFFRNYPRPDPSRENCEAAREALRHAAERLARYLVEAGQGEGAPQDSAGETGAETSPSDYLGSVDIERPGAPAWIMETSQPLINHNRARHEAYHLVRIRRLKEAGMPITETGAEFEVAGWLDTLKFLERYLRQCECWGF